MRQYIAATDVQYNTIEKHVNAPLFRRIFDCELSGEGILEISTAGLYRVFLNGKELTKGFFAPYISNPEQIVYYDEYRVENYLKEKNNELLVLLGNGFNNVNDYGIWEFSRASYRSAPKFSLRLCVNHEEILITDESFEVYASPILFDDLRCGEWYDARMEKDVFKNSSKPVLVEVPQGEYRKCSAHPILLEREIRVKEISRGSKGYLYDFGENNAGVCRLSINAAEGQIIDMTFCEMRNGNEPDLRSIIFPGKSAEGYVQRDRYICKKGQQEYTPSFTYHGFQYVYVEGVTEEQATESLLTYMVIHSAIEKRASFISSNDVVNKIQDCVLRSDTSNFFYYPTDCPHREKNGWTGDVAVSAEQLNYNFDVYASLREWLFMVRNAQLDSGQIPCIVPTCSWGYEWGSGLIWDYVLVELVYQLYRFYGKKEVVEENIAAIDKYISYMWTKKNEDGLFAYGLGDWCEAGSEDESEYRTPLEVAVSLTAIAFLNKAAELHRVLEHFEKADEMEISAQQVRKNIRKKYISNCAVNCMSQTAQAMAIALNVFEESEKQEAYQILLKLIERDDNCFRVGIVGILYLFDVLCDFGDAKLALDLVTQSKGPSYGNLIAQGATTLWEMFLDYEVVDGRKERKDGKEHMVSFNHHFYGCISAWFFRRLAGINILSKDNVSICPSFECGMEWVEAEYRNENNFIKVTWRRERDCVNLTINNRGFTGMICGDVTLEEGLQTYTIMLTV